MAKSYKIGDAVINLETLVSVGDVVHYLNGNIGLSLMFEMNTKVDVLFGHSQITGMTVEQAEQEKQQLIDAWEYLSRFN